MDVVESLDPQGEILNLLFELHKFHLETVRDLTEQRIQGMTAYVVGIAVLTAFYINRPVEEHHSHTAYRGLVVTATVLMVVFHTHWWFYIYENISWADDYFNEMEQQLIETEAGTTAGAHPQRPFKPETGPGAAPCANPSEVEPCWRAQNDAEIAAVWCHQPVATPRAEWSACRDRISTLNIIFASRQLNVWTVCILVFGALALWYSRTRQRPHLAPKS